jgi:hypothetical protein
VTQNAPASPGVQPQTPRAREPSYEEQMIERERIFQYDIGSGSPAEVIRETDLVRELIIEYFENYSDIHFLFDQQCFLRDFDLGETPKLVLYAIMALAVRLVKPYDIFYFAEKFSDIQTHKHFPARLDVIEESHSFMKLEACSKRNLTISLSRLFRYTCSSVHII